jgi:hypothetical protein
LPEAFGAHSGAPLPAVGPWQTVHEPPQSFTLVRLTHVLPQSSAPAPHE